ncbi:MAG: phosphatidylglycerophosphate synthase [Candidatus Azotimanducaceae bacterium]|jgi:phosphatidylglycerophosphate synthase
MNDKLTCLWQTKTKDDEYWSSFVTSPLAIVLNYFVVDVQWLTPNRLTLLSFLVALASAGFILANSPGNFIVAAVLINLSHVLDCMDGQMARYRKSTSLTGSYYDKFTDQLQVIIWFGAIGYTAYMQSHSAVPLMLAFVGVAFYSLRGYVKYVGLYTMMQRDQSYSDQLAAKQMEAQPAITAGLGFGLRANLLWFLAQQKKILNFDEGVFILMLSIALVFDVITPMLWVFAISQLILGLLRGLQRAKNLTLDGVHIICK